MMLDRLLALSELLLDEGYVDNEPDARLAALHILATVGDPAAAPAGDGRQPEPEPEPT